MQGEPVMPQIYNGAVPPKRGLGTTAFALSSGES